MTKIWNEAFWKNAPADEDESLKERPLSTSRMRGMVIPCVALASFSIFLSVLARPLFDLALTTATQLLNPAAYISAVLGEVP